MKNPPRVVERKTKKMVTNAHFMNDKQIKEEPYLVMNNNKEGGDSESQGGF